MYFGEDLVGRNGIQPWVGADSGVACWIDDDVLWIDIAWGGVGSGDAKQNAVVLQKDERQ